jgi:gluconate 2-dehydrogenase gamma chain
MTIDRRLFLLTLSAPLYAAVPLTVLSPDDAKVVEALCAQIVPADDAPGAREAGVVYYIDTQLAGPLARFSAAYKTGIPALNAACLAQTGKSFPDLPFRAQSEFLHRVAAAPNSPPNQFFQLVIDHTMQGFYGSPNHGGNKDEASWKMLGIADVMEGHKH